MKKQRHASKEFQYSLNRSINSLNDINDDEEKSIPKQRKLLQQKQPIDTQKEIEKEEPLDPEPTRCQSIISTISSCFDKLPFSTIPLNLHYRNKKHYSTCCLKLSSILTTSLLISYIASRIMVMNAITGINNEMVDFRSNLNLASEFSPLKLLSIDSY